MDNINSTIIFEIGSKNTKAGFFGHSHPLTIFPTVTYNPKCCYGQYIKDNFYGNNVLTKRNAKLNFPVNSDFIVDMDNYEKIINYTYTNELKVDSSLNSVILTDTSYSNKERKKVTQIMFETFSVPSLYIADQAALSLYSVGKLTGIVFDTGNINSRFVTVFDGFALSDAKIRFEIGESDIDKYKTSLVFSENKG